MFLTCKHSSRSSVYYQAGLVSGDALFRFTYEVVNDFDESVVSM